VRSPAARLNALGNGWSAQVDGDATNYGSWPSADLCWPPQFREFNASTTGQGALQCVNGSFAELKMHTYELAGFQWDDRLKTVPVVAWSGDVGRPRHNGWSGERQGDERARVAAASGRGPRGR
jgi:hypothetical protein